MLHEQSPCGQFCKITELSPALRGGRSRREMTCIECRTCQALYMCVISFTVHITLPEGNTTLGLRNASHLFVVLPRTSSNTEIHTRVHLMLSLVLILSITTLRQIPFQGLFPSLIHSFIHPSIQYSWGAYYGSALYRSLGMRARTRLVQEGTKDTKFKEALTLRCSAWTPTTLKWRPPYILCLSHLASCALLPGQAEQWAKPDVDSDLRKLTVWSRRQTSYQYSSCYYKMPQM